MLNIKETEYLHKEDGFFVIFYTNNLASYRKNQRNLQKEIEKIKERPYGRINHGFKIGI